MIVNRGVGIVYLATVNKTGDFMNGGNQMIALNLCCHTDGGHWLWATEANQIHNGWHIFWRLSLQWVEIICGATQMDNGLKYFLKAQFTMGWKGFEATQIHNGLKSFLIQHRFEMGSNLFLMHKDSQSLTKLYVP